MPFKKSHHFKIKNAFARVNFSEKYCLRVINVTIINVLQATRALHVNLKLLYYRFIGGLWFQTSASIVAFFTNLRCC